MDDFDMCSDETVEETQNILGYELRIPSPTVPSEQQQKRSYVASDNEYDMEFESTIPKCSRNVEQTSESTFKTYTNEDYQQLMRLLKTMNMKLKLKFKLVPFFQKTLERLKNRPSPQIDDDNMDDTLIPTGLHNTKTGVTIKLHNHQICAIRWLVWREECFPKGGILADDMGLGKTLTILSYLKLIKDRTSGNEPLKTLIVLPAALICQWEDEIQLFELGSFKYLKYHGNSCDLEQDFNEYDIVLASIIRTKQQASIPEEDNGKKDVYDPKRPIKNTKWNRIIIDEAHCIKNDYITTSRALCSLYAESRILVTGTPIHNSLLNLYSYVKFLKIEPFCDKKVWNSILGLERKLSATRKTEKSLRGNSKKNTKNEYYDYAHPKGKEMAEKCLEILRDSLILRRDKNTKSKLGRPIIELPARNIIEEKLILNGIDGRIYNSIFHEYSKEIRLNLKKIENPIIRYEAIIKYLLRLRQSCCHFNLLAANNEDIREILEKNGWQQYFKPDYLSTKLKKVLELVNKILDENKQDKIIIASEWIPMLQIVGKHLPINSWILIDGATDLQDRDELIKGFNKPDNTDERVMLLSVKAGGVGLNLVGANHMFFLNANWNPAIELQTFDRIHRMGQLKPVFIHTFVCQKTIEERVMDIQSHKLQIAKRVLGDPKWNAEKDEKLSSEDINHLIQPFNQLESADNQ